MEFLKRTYKPCSSNDQKARKLAAGRVASILTNKVLDCAIDVKDIKDVSILVGPRFAVNVGDYKSMQDIKNLVKRIWGS